MIQKTRRTRSIKIDTSTYYAGKVQKEDIKENCQNILVRATLVS